MSQNNTWPVEKACAWHAPQPWACGFNHVPANIVNSTEMWMDCGFDPAFFEAEIRLAKSAGFNCLRVFLPFIETGDRRRQAGSCLHFLSFELYKKFFIPLFFRWHYFLQFAKISRHKGGHCLQPHSKQTHFHVNHPSGSLRIAVWYNNTLFK